jgi:uncharacterized coiled-coil protein SlyX
MSELSAAPVLRKSPQFDLSFIKNNTNIIRIIIEVVVVISICYYFISKNTRTLKHVEELSQRVEEQEYENEKMRIQISELTASIDSVKQPIVKPSPKKQTRLSSLPTTVVPSIVKVKAKTPEITKMKDLPVIEEVEEFEEVEEEEVEEVEEEDFDEELKAELADLD